VDWLNTHGIKFETLDVIAEPEAYEEMIELSGQSYAPVIEVGDDILADFGPEELARFWEKLKTK